MSEHTPFYQPPHSSGYRQDRRRWIPKGVALLAVLFMVGLLGACHSVSQLVAAIAVPVESEAFVAAVDEDGHELKFHSVSK